MFSLEKNIVLEICQNTYCKSQRRSMKAATNKAGHRGAALDKKKLKE